METTEFDVLECSSIAGSSSTFEEAQFDLSFESSFENTRNLNGKTSSRTKKISVKALSNQQKLLKKAISTAVNCLIRSRRCKLSCLAGISVDFVKRERTKVWTKNFEGRVEWFSDKYSEAINKERSIRFTVEDGKQICSKCFQNLYRLDKSFYYKYVANFERGAVSAGFRNYKQHHTTTEKAIEWMHDFALFHGDQMPDKGVILLAYKTRKIDIYNQYVEEEIEKMQRSVSKANFYKIWKEKFPHLKIKQTNSFSKCNTCTKLDAQLQVTRDPLEREEIKGLIKAHNYRQMMERKYYYSKRNQAKENSRRFMSIIIDGMDQMKTNLPHFLGRRSNDLDVANLLSTHIQGVINHGLEKFTKYLDINEYAHDSNMVINTILKELYGASLQMGNFLPPTLYIQADNCFRENKNRYTLGFCELLIWKNIFKEVHLSFLFVGHTHEDIDAGFSKIADQLRRNEAGTIPRLLSLIPNTRQLRGLYDIKNWLTPCLNSVAHHTKPHHFRFRRNEENKIITEYKGSHNSQWKQLQRPILKQIPRGLPKILKPQNFHKINIDALEKNIDRSKFLFSDQNQFQWWRRFTAYLRDLQSDTRMQLEYAKEHARWLLPLLPKQKDNLDRQAEQSRINPELHEMVDKELDEPQVQMQVKRNVPSMSKERRKAGTDASNR
ncbi:uncharacterized protein LOC134228510, partial [Saccostrea cucullata]|uniref:uncharacterized protein LOC134228510 n=1 Tax=Saccostrea cuccullata TaxID=36930 RepID=UPI002ED36D71